MAGPTVSMPPSMSQMFDIVTDADGKLLSLNLRPQWAAFFQTLQNIAFASSRTGSTSARPTSTFAARFEGMTFFDRTLGHPIWLQHASSDVWVRYDGAGV